MNSIIEILILSSDNLINVLEEKDDKENLSADEIREKVFRSFHSIRYGVPDHVFLRYWSLLSQDGSSPLLNSLKALADQFFQYKDTRISINLNQFGDWQNVLSRISSIPVCASFIAQIDDFPDEISELYKIIRKSIYSRPFFRPYDKDVEEYIESAGLNETHLHLNGVTVSDACWLQALLYPKEEVKNFSDGYKNPSVKELVMAIDPKLNPEVLLFRLQSCQAIRSFLIGYCSGKEDGMGLYEILKSVRNDDYVPANNIFDTFKESNISINDQYFEITWIAALIKKLVKVNDSEVLKIFHFYLLVSSQYLQLLVQRDDAFGFQQFEKLTFTKLRSSLEGEYYERFMQLHGGLEHSQIDLLEARFAPLRNWKQIEKGFVKIFSGFAKYLMMPIVGTERLPQLLDILGNREESNPRKLTLSLVAHFIKKPWEPTSVPRHGELRIVLKEQSSALIQGYKAIESLSEWVKGIDAASNELHAGPDVFAPIFRICKYAGICGKTYHVGEDYDHLLSGLRHVEEALSLLDMSTGDRIGHAIALGIKPDQWIKAMPPNLILRRGEWMLDSLICWSILRHDIEFATESNLLRSAAESEALKIFGQSIDCERLLKFAYYRRLWPENIRDFILYGKCQESLNDAWNNEGELVNLAANEDRYALEMAYKWTYSDEVHKVSEELIQVRTAFCSNKALIRIQQNLAKMIMDKNVVIETLPTSNVRISQYEHIWEHHVFRWLGIEGAAVPGDPEFSISLGSDDPGIFATDVASEFYHIFAGLVENFGFSRKEALAQLKLVNDNGRKAIFSE